MTNIVNPYIAGAPVTEQRMFFGREDIFQWIENSISGRYADHILVVHGQRRVGKTSVLKQLGNRLPPKYIPVFFDLQGRTHTTLDHFLWWLARETVRVLKQERGIEVPPPDKEDFAKDPEYFENAFLPGLRPALGENGLLYTFDEFDNLEESDVKEELARPLTDYLRRLMGRGEMSFIYSIGSSGRKLENMQAAYTDFFKTALYKKISFLSEEQTHGLVTRPVEGLIEYERAAVERIYAVASGHPYFTQLTCHELFARCQRTEQRRITQADVEAVLDDVVERGTVNLKFVWDEASDIEKWSLAALAHLDKTDHRTLADFLRKNRVRFSESDLTSGLLHLREKDVLTPQNRFVIHLLQLWLRKNRPIEQVREELTEANPIASRFIEIGLEFRDGGQHEKAIEYFRQALSVSADNLQAQVNIALAYTAQGQLEQAVGEFEKALSIDDEDVASRAGLCDAHLALGDAAMKRGRAREAILSYQRVLEINAEHLEARQRMAEISRRRGEKALTDGRDEEALSAFTEALKYTPEDAALLARVEKVRAEKKAKVLAAQVARSEKEAAARNWDKAIAALNEALETAPGEASILKKIESLKAKQLQEQLDAILAKVAAAEKVGRWDTAIAGLHDYLRLKPDDAAIQKRIAALVEAKHAAWQKAVLERVDQAAAAQNWDEALSALNEALRLEPENAVMQARAGQVRAERRSAELNARLARAEAAAGAGRWDEAIEVLNDGLAAEPENETLKTRLAQARKAKREARLQAALRLADRAAQAGKWETAAASLQEVLVNEPDNPEFIQKLTEIKGLERESRLGGLETLAQSLLKAEKFDEALAAWNEYLALLPADREKAQAEIAAVKKAQTLASLYEEATGAHAKKNYEKAIDLFKRIVVEDADYKDTTDLLAEAVRLRRAGQKAPRVFNRKAWLTGGLALLLALGIGAAVLWIGKNGLPAMPAVSKDNTTTPASAATRATPTTAETSALDPAVQAALDTIRNEEPLYQTTFDDWDSDDAGQGAALVNGKLVLTGDANGAYFPLNAYPSDKYVVEYEIGITDSKGVCFYGAGNGAPPGESFRGFTAEFFPGEGLAVLARYVPQTGLDERLVSASFDKTKPNVVTLFVLGEKVTAFINGQLAYTVQNPTGGIAYVSHGLSAYNQTGCEFDYFKYWDLREMDPAVKTALATIQNEEPLYQTSFDSWDFGHPRKNARVENGKLIVSNDSDINTYVTLNNFEFNSQRFAVEFETQISENLQQASCSLGISKDDTNFRVIFFPSGHYQVDIPKLPNDLIIGSGRFDPSVSNAVKLIVLDDQFSLFINDEMSFTKLDPEGSKVYTSGLFEASSRITCEFDNYKFWDLSELDPAVRAALAVIQREEPVYQTSFDAWDFGDLPENVSVENGKLIVSNPVDGQQVPATLDSFRLENFAAEFEFRGLNPSKDGHCTFNVNDDDDKHGVVTYFHIVGEGYLDIVVPQGQENLAVSPVDMSRTNKITLLVLGDQIFVIKNGQLMFNVLEPRVRAVYTRLTFAANYKIDCEYDNFKVWDLSGVDFPATTGATPTGTKPFFGSALAWVADKTPDYEDDFSNPASGWPTNQNSTGEVGYQDDEYFISDGGDCYGASPPTNKWFSDFVLEMDVKFINQGRGTMSIFFRNNDTAHYGANLSPWGGFNFHKNVNHIHTDLLGTEVPASSFQAPDTPKHLTLIARQDRMALYVNGQLVIALADTSSSQGTFGFGVCDGNPLQVLIDNLKIWDITGLSP